jgi:hypothetical protein
MAFIVDIRRENRNLHLFYKALFELSADRADFVARLFSRPRPGGLDATSSVKEIFDRFENVKPSPEQLQWNADRVRAWLVETRRLPLEQADLEEIHFWRSAEVSALKPSYRRLMTLPDSTGESRSFLATENGFRFVKDLHASNLIVPLVGDFGGSHTLRRVGDDVRARGYTVRAFYGSNVGVYLTNQQTRAFCRNLAALPAGDDAWFIERDGVRSLASKLKACAPPS